VIGVFSPTTTITIAADGHFNSIATIRRRTWSQIARPNLVQPEDPGSEVPENQKGESDRKK
jgi:hypothetical protein